jgi:hypothetical protein
MANYLVTLFRVLPGVVAGQRVGGSRMVVGSKAEDVLFSMTRGEVEKELLKLPGHNDFKRFNTHLVRTDAEWPAMVKKLKSGVEAWDKDKRECPALALILLPCSLVLCLQPSSTLSSTY